MSQNLWLVARRVHTESPSRLTIGRCVKVESTLSFTYALDFCSYKELDLRAFTLTFTPYV